MNMVSASKLELILTIVLSFSLMVMAGAAPFKGINQTRFKRSDNSTQAVVSNSTQGAAGNSTQGVAAVKLRSMDGNIVDNIQALLTAVQSIKKDMDSIKKVIFPPMRLVGSDGSPHQTAGRLEFFVSGQWGSMCDDHHKAWEQDNTFAKVACRMLGLRGGTIRNSAYYGPGTGPVHFHNGKKCSGNELSIFQCPGTPRGHCGHSEDVGVECQSSQV